MQIDSPLRTTLLLSFVIVCCGFIGSYSPHAYTAEVEAKEETDTNSSEQSAPKDTPKESTNAGPASGSEGRRAGDTGGIFRPSEEISEDVAITFPVDI